jgi:hypothetical protein
MKTLRLLFVDRFSGICFIISPEQLQSHKIKAEKIKFLLSLHKYPLDRRGWLNKQVAYPL